MYGKFSSNVMNLFLTIAVIIAVMNLIITLICCLFFICLAHIPLQYAPNVWNIGNILSRLEQRLFSQFQAQDSEHELV